MNRKEQLIFGWHPVLEALDTGKEFQKVFMLAKGKSERANEVMEKCSQRSIPVQFVPQQKLDRLTRKVHQGIVAFLSPIEFADLDNLIASLYDTGKTPSFMALDGVTDVRNFGAICRSAECFGFDGVIVPSKGMAPINEDAIKTSAGALMRLPVCRVKSMKSAISLLKNNGITLFGMTEKAAEELSSYSYEQPVCLIMGSEDEGLSSEVVKNCDHLVKIPMMGKTQSLNVSVSAGVAMYEVLRNRSISS